MTEKTLFVTGKMAESQLRSVLETIHLNFDYEIWNAGVKVAALITEAILLRRLPRPLNFTRVILPGRCRANLDRLSNEYCVTFTRGPDELIDLASYFGKKSNPIDFSRHSLRIFAEIVDAPTMSADEIELRGIELARSGADVIDLGCVPGVWFPHLEDTIRRLQLRGLKVSVDSASLDELKRASTAGADYLLSFTEFTIDSIGNSRPVLIPANHGNLESLVRAYEYAVHLGIEPILDPILDPIHFGLADSISRYRDLRNRLPNAEMLMGTGNLTELTEADSGGLTSILIGLCSELSITNALTVNVSSHTRRTVQEHDAARKLMYAAKQSSSLPKGFGTALLQIHDKGPYVASIDEINLHASLVRDDNLRIQVAQDGIHVFNKYHHLVSKDIKELWPKLSGFVTANHAIYLGAELQKADIAYKLGKRYVQDESINWGVAVDEISCD